MTPALLPCPFCGGDAEHYETIDPGLFLDFDGLPADGHVTRYEQTGCPRCGVWRYATDDEGASVRDWNRRAI